MTFDDLYAGGYAWRGLRTKNIIIDDADRFLGRAAGYFKIQRITLSKPFSKSEKEKLDLSPNQDY